MTNIIELEPRIYIASLSDYNSGRLHGIWIDVEDKQENEIFDDIQKMLNASTEQDAEEWAVHDYEGFGSMQISEYENIKDIVAYSRLIREYGEAITAFMSWYGYNENEAEQKFEEAYQGHFSSFREFSDDLFDETYGTDIPERIQYYIDYESFARDLEINDYASMEARSGGVHIFSAHI